MNAPPKSYTAAQAELEEILAALQSPNTPLDELGERVKRAKALIIWLKDALRDAEEEVKELLDEVA